ncbi:ATP-grasp fold amidoligase family protein [Mangrovibacterium diazotrophicum]|uniref:Teichuronopeptide biosynthesis TupA-like protein n=1 Tax=Mangrovibacterium diazotrophicum TaxID=1261403 RepID=A0A419VW37_9BACT|nr:ATP-grasp fold amidoligase family protein [Mangrovibacterium diazotrophicum]RKD86355.1 teichuronopeptide biosynthesis TupA-like protein [Mangrovibacterium diazotrophicum]
MKDLFLNILRKTTNDKLYYQLRHWFKHRGRAHLKKPQTFNSKLIWLNLYDRNPQYASFVDKYDVRKYISDRIGSEYLNELYGVYERVDDIDFESLPNDFVLKATHGSGWIIVCEDKSKLDIDSARKQMAGWLNKNFYDLYGEWVYKELKPRVICEKFLRNDNESGLTDYKIYCFNDTPRFIQVDMDRYENHTRTYFDLEWQQIHFELGGCKASSSIIPKPSQFKKMLEIAGILCKGFKFIRVDLYLVGEKIYFGELTLYSGNGMLNFSPKQYDKKIGELLDLESSN